MKKRDRSESSPRGTYRGPSRRIKVEPLHDPAKPRPATTPKTEEPKKEPRR